MGYGRSFDGVGLAAYRPCFQSQVHCSPSRMDRMHPGRAHARWIPMAEVRGTRGPCATDALPAVRRAIIQLHDRTAPLPRFPDSGMRFRRDRPGRSSHSDRELDQEVTCARLRSRKYARGAVEVAQSLAHSEAHPWCYAAPPLSRRGSDPRKTRFDRLRSRFVCPPLRFRSCSVHASLTVRSAFAVPSLMVRSNDARWRRSLGSLPWALSLWASRARRR